MIKKLLVLVLGLMGLMGAAEAYEYQIKGAIISPEASRLPPFKIHYWGHQAYSNREGYFTFPLEKAPVEKYYLLITDEFMPRFEKVNTIATINADKKRNYRYYQLKKVVDPKKKTTSWAIKEKRLDKRNFVAPQDKTIIVVMDSKLVKSVENWKVQLDDKFVAFPQIILKKNAELAKMKVKKTKGSVGRNDMTALHEHKQGEQYIHREAAKSFFKSFESGVFHEQISEKKLVTGNPKRPVEVSLPQ